MPNHKKSQLPHGPKSAISARSRIRPGGLLLRLRACLAVVLGFPTSLVSAGRPGHRLRHLRHRRRPPPGGPTPLQGPLLPLHLRPRLPPLLVKSFRLGLPVPLPRPPDPPRRRPDAAWVAGAASLSGASSPSRASSKVPQQLPRILRQLLLRRRPCHLRRSPIPLPRPGRRARPSAAAAGLPRGGPLPPPLPPVRSGFLPERLHLYNFNFKHNQADVH